MSEPGVRIPINGDASGLDSAIDRASSALRGLGRVAADVSGGGVRRLQNETERAASKADRAASAIDRFGTAAKGLNKAAQVTGGQLSFLTGPLDDLSDLLELGGVRMAAMSVGLVAGATALYGMASAASAAAAAVYDTASNATDLLAELDAANKSVLPEHREALLQAESALRGWDAAALDLGLTLTGTLSPALTDIADTASGLVIGFTGLVDGVALWSAEIDASLDVLSPWYRTLSGISDVMGGILDITAESGRATRQQAAAAAEAGEANTAWMKAIEAQFAAEDKAAAASRERATAIRDVTSAQREQAQAGGLNLSEADIGVEGIYIATSALTEMAMAAETTVAEVEHLNLLMMEAGNTAASGMTEAMTTSREEWDEYYDHLNQRAVAWASNAIDLTRSVFGVAVAVSDATTNNERKAAKKRAIIAKAAAITEASINTLVGVTKALAGSSPPVNFILAGLTAAFGAVQIGLIAAKPLVYHRGGMLDPDEERLSASSTVVRRNESIGIVTGGGAAAAQRAMARVNAGEVTSGDTYLMVDGDLFRTRRVGGPDAGYGRSGRT